MSDDQQIGSALSVEVSGDGAKAHVGNKLVDAVGSATAWLFPKRDARVKITQAIRDRVIAKIASGEPFDEQERGFISLVFSRESGQLLNVEAVTDRVAAVLPEVQSLVKRLPPPSEERSTTETFVRRGEAIAGEIYEDNLRDMFARVLAGELCRPGGFSIKTLETIRSLDPKVAAAFDVSRAFLFDQKWNFGDAEVTEFKRRAGITVAVEAELRDAGLTDTFLHPNWHSSPEGAHLRFGKYTIHLVPTGKTKSGDSLLIGGSPHLTRVGREIASVLPPPHYDNNYFFAAGKWIDRQLKDKAAVTWTQDGDESSYSF